MPHVPPSLVVPPALDAQRRLGPDWGAWLDRLPRLAADLVEEWDLTLDGPVWHGFCSLVPAVRTADGTPAVLKITFDGDEESEHEALALQHWGGRGTVRLFRADPRRRALLLERLGHDDLSTVGYVEACETVGELYSSPARAGPAAAAHHLVVRRDVARRPGDPGP